ncbi:hypothetical protein [Streptomyces sp. NPDC008001]|uniref:hypothetical protein n=1 Tax=Streptomyces sp. NPDC008001 TaxID=3364804 RepID=UPI0036E581B6
MRCLARAAMLVAALGTCAAVTAPVATGAGHQRPRTERVSVAADGTQGNSDSYTAGISADGRYATFRSMATNLTPRVGGGLGLFIKDLRTGAVEQANVASDGTPADDSSFDIALSADGRYAVFDSRAGNLSPDKTPGETDLFVRDRRTGRTELLLENKQHQAGTSFEPSVSADGRYVAFTSFRTDLVPGPSKDPVAVYVRDRWKGTTKRVSVRSDGSQAGTRSALPVISADGSKVGFLSLGGLGEGEPGIGDSGPGLARPRLNTFYVHDLRTGRTELASRDRDGSNSGASDIGFSPDGHYALFSTRSPGVVPGKTTQTTDIYARDLKTGVTRRLSLAHDGSEAQGDSRGPVMSADNRKVFFTSTAPNLIPGGSGGSGGSGGTSGTGGSTGSRSRTAVYARDLLTGAVQRLDVADDGTPADGDSSGVAVDRSGRTAVFTSAADNLVPGDTNKADDVFLRRVR